MKQPFGAKPAGFYMRSMLWIAANRTERRRRWDIDNWRELPTYEDGDR